MTSSTARKCEIEEPTTKASEGVDRDFVVELRQSGTTVVVPANCSLGQVLRDIGASVVFACQEGRCGSCQTTVLSGIPDHRDEVLSEEERERGDVMMVCVGRAKSERLVLDL